jgi:diguanylate cyclase (GGDEF)-like protein
MLRVARTIVVALSKDGLVRVTTSRDEGASMTPVSVQIRRLVRQLANARRQLELLATTDALTGIWNRRHAMGRFAEEMARQRRSQNPLSCAIVDVDHFKRVNDTWGHRTGDIVLRQVAAALQSAIRRYDVVGRYGDEEFFAILPGAGALAAGTVCERLRQSVQEREVVVGCRGRGIRNG